MRIRDKPIKNSDLISTHLKVCGFTVVYIKKLLKQYYIDNLVDTLFEYEFLK